MLGCDIISVERIGKSYTRYGSAFLERILTKSEQKIFADRKENITFLAGRFAAKEAVSKAFKTGIGELEFTDIEILPDALGAPTVYIRSVLSPNIEVSISHCKEYAIAACIIKSTQ